MPNLILTNSCNNKCTYCFTNGTVLEDITLKNLKEISPFISSFHNKKLNILGGEPSLNPEFISILQYLLSEEYELLIFTNGDISPSVLVQLQGLMCGKFEFIVNRSSNFLTANTVKFYKTLGHRIKIGLTIFKSRQYVQHAIREIEDYRLRKAIRIGIALPSYSPSNNTYLSPAAYPRISSEIFPFLVECIRKGIKPEFDCGFPYCFFTDEQREYSSLHSVHFASLCGIIPDLLPDHSAIPCFPLAHARVDLHGQSSWSEVISGLEKKVAGMKMNLIFAHCQGCTYLQEAICSGGCKAVRIRWKSLAPEIGRERAVCHGQMRGDLPCIASSS